MKIKDCYVTPIATQNCIEYVPIAETLFDRYSSIMKSTENPSYFTTLKRYQPFWCSESLVDWSKDNEAQSLEKMFIDASDKFLTKIGYDTSEVELSLENMWLNRLKTGANTILHIHTGFCSGAFYVRTPELQPALQFYNPTDFIRRPRLPIKEQTQYVNKIEYFPPEIGDLIIWESHLLHDVPYYMGSEDRMVISFDVVGKYKGETL